MAANYDSYDAMATLVGTGVLTVYFPESVKFNPIKIPLISHFTRISAILKPQISSPIG